MTEQSGLAAEEKAFLDETRELEQKATKGPWEWNIAPDLKDCKLQTSNDGKRYVMGFARWGTQNAAPMFQKDFHMRRADEFAKSIPGKEHHIGYDDYIDHPDALFIAASRAAIPRLLSIIERLTNEQKDIAVFVEQTEEAQKVECQHEWKLQSTDKYSYSDGNYGRYFVMENTFYCGQCLEIKTIRVKSGHEMYGATPPWW